MEQHVEWIEIVNWEKYNPRGQERKKFRYHWFRIDHTLFSDPKFIELNSKDICVFVYLLSITCQQQGKPWPIYNREVVAHQSRVTPAEFNRSLAKLLKLNVVRFCDHSRTNAITFSAIQDRTGQDRTEQDRTNNTSPPSEAGQLGENSSPPNKISKDSTSTPPTTTKPQVVGTDPKPEPFGPAHLQAVWNEHCGSLPRCNALNKSRLARARARINETPPEADPWEYWRLVVKAIASSGFHRGDNDRGWRASFDYLIKSDTHLKAHEGSIGKASKQAKVVTLEWKE